jgi:CheY-like chemotaxis protein
VRTELRSSIRVLVIDDSVVARTMMVELLSSAGYSVFSIPSAIGATRIIYQHSIDVVLVDLGMPGLSGDKLIGLLRSNPKLRRLILIVVSGESDEELARLLAEGNVQAVFRKRDIEERLLRELQHLLLASSASRETPAKGRPAAEAWHPPSARKTGLR